MDTEQERANRMKQYGAVRGTGDYFSPNKELQGVGQDVLGDIYNINQASQQYDDQLNQAWDMSGGQPQDYQTFYATLDRDPYYNDLQSQYDYYNQVGDSKSAYALLGEMNNYTDPYNFLKRQEMQTKIQGDPSQEAYDQAQTILNLAADYPEQVPPEMQQQAMDIMLYGNQPTMQGIGQEMPSPYGEVAGETDTPQSTGKSWGALLSENAGNIPVFGGFTEAATRDLPGALSKFKRGDIKGGLKQGGSGYLKAALSVPYSTVYKPGKALYNIAR